LDRAIQAVGERNGLRKKKASGVRLGAFQQWRMGDVQFPMSCGAHHQGNAQISLDMHEYYGA
jgi:hypothetical protein